MAEMKTPTEGHVETGEIRSQLVKRLVVAGALVAILLGVLALFDRLANRGEESEEVTYTKPVPVQPQRQVTQTVTPVPPPEPVVIEPPPAPDPRAEPNLVPAPKSGAVAKAPVAAPAKTPDKRTHAPTVVIPDSTAAPAISPRPAPDETVALPLVIERHHSPARRLFSGFLVQAGVFSSAQRAEELQAQLNLNGVPATLETRVQVGPFKTRQEAEVAQARLKNMGIESLLVPPKGAKN